MKKYLSSGWGVQSFTLKAMMALGEIENVTAIHSDTTHESAATYAFIKQWEPWLADRGVNVVTVKQDEEKITVADYAGHSTDIPAFSINQFGDRGQIRRKCTSEWKISPLRRYIAAELKAQGIKKSAGAVEMWLGISLDEFQRMKDSDVKYITNKYPLIEKRMTRKDCEAWLEAHGLPIPPKSACVFCPFHDMRGWRAIKDNPDDWSRAVATDEAIRDIRVHTGNKLYIHPKRIPLADVDLSTPQERGQGELFADDECAGVCFI